MKFKKPVKQAPKRSAEAIFTEDLIPLLVAARKFERFEIKAEIRMDIWNGQAAMEAVDDPAGLENARNHFLIAARGLRLVLESFLRGSISYFRDRLVRFSYLAGGKDEDLVNHVEKRILALESFLAFQQPRAFDLEAAAVPFAAVETAFTYATTNRESRLEKRREAELEAEIELRAQKAAEQAALAAMRAEDEKKALKEQRKHEAARRLEVASSLRSQLTGLGL